jgi:iron complex transport system ATP-binding protein
LAAGDVQKISARELARVVSVVLTDRATAGMLSAYALVALSRHPHTNWLGGLTDADHTVIRRSMEITGAAEFADRLVTELSDGERQKVMVARALAQEPQIMVLDEITAFLDLPRRVEIMGMLRTLAHETGRAMLLSTHDLDLALRASDRTWLLPKDGCLTVGSPEDLVLSGAFESAFASEGVQFEPELGSFRIRSAAQGSINLRGTGLARVWTARALERAGYRIVEDPSSIQVVVQNGDANPVWQIGDATEATFNSIEQLIEAIAGPRGPYWWLEFCPILPKARAEGLTAYQAAWNHTGRYRATASVEAPANRTDARLFGFRKIVIQRTESDRSGPDV